MDLKSIKLYEILNFHKSLNPIVDYILVHTNKVTTLTFQFVV